MEHPGTRPPSRWWPALQICLAFLLVMVGMTVFSAGGRLSGALVAVAGGCWLARRYRAL